MKRFGVINFRNDSLMDFGYMNREQQRVFAGQRGISGIAYHSDPERGNAWDGQHISQDVPVYWTDSAADADALAQNLSAKFGGRSWVVFEASAAYVSVPSTPKKVLITEKGVVPE